MVCIIGPTLMLLKISHDRPFVLQILIKLLIVIQKLIKINFFITRDWAIVLLFLSLNVQFVPSKNNHIPIFQLAHSLVPIYLPWFILTFSVHTTLLITMGPDFSLPLSMITLMGRGSFSCNPKLKHLPISKFFSPWSALNFTHQFNVFELIMLGISLIPIIVPLCSCHLEFSTRVSVHVLRNRIW